MTSIFRPRLTSPDYLSGKSCEKMKYFYFKNRLLKMDFFIRKNWSTYIFEGGLVRPFKWIKVLDSEFSKRFFWIILKSWFFDVFLEIFESKKSILTSQFLRLSKMYEFREVWCIIEKQKAPWCDTVWHSVTKLMTLITAGDIVSNEKNLK